MQRNVTVLPSAAVGPAKKCLAPQIAATAPTIMRGSVGVAPSRRADDAPVRRRLRALARCVVAPSRVAVEHPPPHPPDLLALKAAYDRDGVRCSAHPRPRAFL